MIIQSYNDICLKIAGLNNWIDSLNRDIKYYTKLLHSGAPKDISGINYDDMPKGSRNDMSLDRILEAIHKCESHLYLAEEELKCKEKAKKDIEGIMSRMDSMECKIFYLRTVEGKTQEETAEIINKCTRQVQKIEKKLKDLQHSSC